MTTPLIQADVGGGAWRVKWHPSKTRQNDLLVACMHDGFKVVTFNLDGVQDGHDKSSYAKDEWAVTARFDEHQSLAYGVDWSHAGYGDEKTIIASCSFYDHNMRIWRA